MRPQFSYYTPFFGSFNVMDERVHGPDLQIELWVCQHFSQTPRCRQPHMHIINRSLFFVVTPPSCTKSNWNFIQCACVTAVRRWSSTVCICVWNQTKEIYSQNNSRTRTHQHLGAHHRLERWGIRLRKCSCAHKINGMRHAHEYYPKIANSLAQCGVGFIFISTNDTTTSYAATSRMRSGKDIPAHYNIHAKYPLTLPGFFVVVAVCSSRRRRR